MSTDAIIPSAAELNRSTELPAADAQQAEEAQERQEAWDLTQMPGWRAVEAQFEAAVTTYRTPVVTKGMEFEDIGREYVIAQTIAGKLEEVFDAIRAAARG